MGQLMEPRTVQVDMVRGTQPFFEWMLQFYQIFVIFKKTPGRLKAGFN